ncbi:MAG: class I SAM-dependent methyltransferase [Chloroflexi bacterium]|nr:class I SAM-dependent methyltransferase [Chloroflexota bacterium]
MAAVTFPDTPLLQADRAVTDFLKSLKASERSSRQRIIREEYERLAERWQEQQGRSPATLADVAAIMAGGVAYKFDRALSRFSQELMYSRVHELLSPRRAELEAFLDAPVENPLGSLRLNPELPIPAYYEADYHVQPGGMHREPLIGFITAITNKVYFGGSNDSEEQQRASAAACPEGPWERILDLGCGCKSAYYYKLRWPSAEVYGIDLSAPLLKYAHKRAEAIGLAIHFSQQNAEHTDFPNAFFDLVSSCILFHEVPDEAAWNIICEGYRILKPGGWFVINDAAPYRALDLFGAFFSDWQTENNLEPYWGQAGQRDYVEWLRRAGFRNVSDPFTRGEVNGKGRIFPWTTMGQK